MYLHRLIVRRPHAGSRRRDPLLGICLSRTGWQALGPDRSRNLQHSAARLHARNRFEYVRTLDTDYPSGALFQRPANAADWRGLRTARGSHSALHFTVGSSARLTGRPLCPWTFTLGDVLTVRGRLYGDLLRCFVKKASAWLPRSSQSVLSVGGAELRSPCLPPWTTWKVTSAACSSGWP